MTKTYRQDNAMYQALTDAGYKAGTTDAPPWERQPDPAPAVHFDDNFDEPWVDDPAPAQRFHAERSEACTTNTTEDNTMTDAKTRSFAADATPNGAAVTSHDTEVPMDERLGAFFSQLGQYPRQNVLERLIQSLVAESARASEFADRIEFGDEVAKASRDSLQLDEAGFPTCTVDTDVRPDPDTTGDQPRSLSEAQFNLATSLRDDEMVALEMASELVGIYRIHCGDQPAYAIRRVGGRWDRITNINLALAHEYNRARANWLRKLEQPAEQRHDAGGSQQVLAAQRAKRRQLMGAF